MSAEQLKHTTAMPVVGKPAATVQVTWSGDHVFEGVRVSGGPAITMDSSGKRGPSPIDTLLCALAGCTGVDVVDILEKRRTPMSAMSVDVVGERFAGTPGRITKIELVNSNFHVIGMFGSSESRTEQYFVTASSIARSACTRSTSAPVMW